MFVAKHLKSQMFFSDIYVDYEMFDTNIGKYLENIWVG